ncbi:MAG: hypothetical protein C0521_01855 [Xanthomonas sp.]|nr:hypothetical protein [Xanthomonas sp.]
MNAIVRRPLFTALAVALLAGCERAPQREDVEAAAQTAAEIADPAPPVTGREAPQFQFSDDEVGIALAPTPGFTLKRDFTRDYLSGGEWKTFAAADVRGEPLVALVLDGSDKITAAELRIGTSTDSHAVVTCLDPPEGASTEAADEVRIDGQPFQHFRVGDAAMSHYQSVEAYRHVRNERCVAIDLLVAGTRPEVYDPPATPPFDEATARARLQEALAAVRITR